MQVLLSVDVRSVQIVQFMISSVEFGIKMNHYAKVCLWAKEKVYLAGEVEVYDSDEFLLKIEQITAIKGCGKQLMSNVTFLMEGKHTEQFPFSSSHVSWTLVLLVMWSASKTKVTCYAMGIRHWESLISVKAVWWHLNTAYRRNHPPSWQNRQTSNFNQPLLSAETCEQLELLQVQIDPEESILVPEISNLTKEYTCSRVHGILETRPLSLTPMSSQSRTSCLERQSQGQVDELERNGIVEKVLAPTEWISTMVRGENPKRSEFVLHFESKDLNKAAIRPKY